MEQRETSHQGIAWEDLKNELFNKDDQRDIAEETKKLRMRAHAYRLVEVRKKRSLTQKQVAEKMGVSQARVSDIERGELERSETATLAAYVHAVGGELKVVADFDGEEFVLG